MMPWIISVLLFLTCYEACVIVPQPVILFPLNAEYRTRDIKDRTAPGIPSGVGLAPGPYGEEDGSYEFFGNASSFIEFPNSPGGALDVRYSMTILCWVYYDENGGLHGPIFNYNTGGRYGVHFWVLNRLFYARFNDRAFTHLPFLHHTSLAGGWKFVGASYDNETGEIKLWADGALKQTRNTAAGVELGTQGSVRMGVRKNDKRYLKGKISQLQIYNEALSQQQILKLATKPEEPCRHLEFIPENIIQGYSLKNHVIRTIQNINEDFCGALCFMEYNCVSFNVKVTGGPGTSKICELNNSTHHANLGDLQTLENSIYHGITVNPCDESLCQHSSTCQAGFTEKGYRCLCGSGFCGEHCETDIDECYVGNECSANALCQNLHGSYNCTCKEGYYGDGKNCRDIDECYAGNECSANALCHNLHGSYNCTCKEGYYGDGKNCKAGSSCKNIKAIIGEEAINGRYFLIQDGVKFEVGW
ncbi:PREDICTED: sushi, von Willebrand factor type A, EGF and pentraxin domain-containing protein 1-like isoform X2 [Acropora digitifera]|uniref:sushi, von Willebrand factor type A, EGF and pentraxin domain-containing protein 1-like isoform X2 n=1 Tax=Acropora digitifera TaxID=70779 RepID=UPI00077ACC9E|nr:PREDICTED: sushi, von Willebrand factor type A, EGF and pentraxin domain-containing protein 1-like isoform X2 [Acropora digitifera]